MMTASEYSIMSDARKREYALAVDVIDRMCRDSISLLHRMQSAFISEKDGRAEYERYEIALLMKRNEIFQRQLEYQMAGIFIQVSTDDRGTPIRVRKPFGFVSLETLAAQAAARIERAESGANDDVQDYGDSALPESKRAAVRMRK